MIWNGKMKAVTFSYDDGVTQDWRLVELMNRYGIKATFNINSELLGQTGELVRPEFRVNHTKVDPDELSELYSGHEIAVHTLTHPTLPTVEADTEVIRQVEVDRLNLTALAGYEIVGMAYPGGGVNFNDRCAQLIKNNTGVKYARTTKETFGFELPAELHTLHPSIKGTDFERMNALADEFLAMSPEKPQLYYIWGHSYEYDISDTWDELEAFFRKISGREDIFYGTNTQCLEQLFR